jgi:hypothetical protein
MVLIAERSRGGHQRLSTSPDAKYKNQQIRHAQQEKELLRYIKRLTSQGPLPSRPMIRRFASQIAGRQVLG